MKDRGDIRTGLAIAAIILIAIALARLGTIIDIAETNRDKLAQIEESLEDIKLELMWMSIPAGEIEALELVPQLSPQNYYPLTPAERDLVERIVAAEARGEPIDGMAAVAQAIRDRAVTWGMTITEVCLYPGQLSYPYQGEISQEVIQAVWAIFDEGMSVLEVPTTHFHLEDVEPYWTSDKVSRGKIGRHKFWY